MASKKKRKNSPDPVVAELSAIRMVLQDLLILECARLGMTADAVRKVVRVDNNRISRIARYAKKKS